MAWDTVLMKKYMIGFAKNVKRKCLNLTQSSMTIKAKYRNS